MYDNTAMWTIRPLSCANTVKPLNSRHLRVLKKLSVSERCPLLGGNLKIATFETQRFVHYSWHVRYLGCPLLGSFAVSELFGGPLLNCNI